MAFTAGTNNIKVMSIASVQLSYLLPGGGGASELIEAENIEQGVSIVQSVANSYITSDGAEIPRSEKVAIQFTLMGTAANITLWKRIINKAPAVSKGLSLLAINLGNTDVIELTNPEMNAFGVSKGGEVTKLLVNCEITASDADAIVAWGV